MCGRFTLIGPAGAVRDAFDLPRLPDLEPRYNVAPTQQVFAVRQAAAGREGVFLKWGLIPSWASDASIGAKLLNARAETIAEKPSFRTAFVRRRCLIPADGFYEWQAVGGKKQPLHFRLRDGRLFAFAGLWERWTSPEGAAVESCTVITTEANALVRPAHERMPAIVDPARYAAWLDPATSAATLRSLLAPWPAEEMAMVPANVRVNNARNEGPACLSVA
jgi:putative SOS response-associated peptidase YedK